MIEKKPKLVIVVPCYNEEQVLPVTAPMFLKKIEELMKNNKISEDSKILFVNDGSNDKTWEIIKNLSQKEQHFVGITQSRNRGHQNAVLAGIHIGMMKIRTMSWLLFPFNLLKIMARG